MHKFGLLLFLLPCLAFAQQGLTFIHDGETRTYNLHLPNNLPANAPLVFVLHGYTSSANTIQGYSGMSMVADTHKFAVCYPQGLRDFGGTPHWNAQLNISNTDDIGFLVNLAKHLQQTQQLDSNATFSCGMSNGGFMSYALGCQRPDVFKAIASVTGTMSGASWNNCDLDSMAIPVFQISGLSDNVVPVNGIPTIPEGWGGAPSIFEVMRFWKEENQCTESDTFALSSRITAYIHSEGIRDNQVWFYAISNWGHSWPTKSARFTTGINGSSEIWKFFRLSMEGTATSNSPVLKTSFSIYPNPVENDLNFREALGKSSWFEIFDLSGRRVMANKLPAFSQKIKVDDLKAGLYLLRIDGQSVPFLKR
ncbi:MAG: PHB depolymerase family esterase [Bacteroidota bacterium]